MSKTLETKTAFGKPTDFSLVKTVWLHLRKKAGSLFSVVCFVEYLGQWGTFVWIFLLVCIIVFTASYPWVSVLRRMNQIQTILKLTI